jgi:hypothetical protein
LAALRQLHRVDSGVREVRFSRVGAYGKSLYEITGKKTEIVSRVAELAIADNGTRSLSSARDRSDEFRPIRDLKASLTIPVTTALSASVAALRTYQAKRSAFANSV